MFTVEPGNVFINADFSGLELAVIAYASNDEVLIKMLENNLNIHDENTKRMFNFDKSHPKWEDYRSVMKTYIFGRNYGGTLKGMYKRMLTKNPDITMPYKTFVEMDKNYFDAHPAYKAWYHNTIKTLQETRCLSNGFGRKRYFLGTDSAIVREGLNFPIQSTAGDLMSLSLIGVYKELKQKKLKAMLIGSVHDSMMIEAPKAEVKEVISVMKKHMTKKHKIFNREVSFKVDFETGPSWGELKEYKV